MKKTFCRCACFFKSNIYLQQLAVHVHFTNDQLFQTEYHHVSDDGEEEKNIDVFLVGIERISNGEIIEDGS